MGERPDNIEPGERCKSLTPLPNIKKEKIEMTGRFKMGPMYLALYRVNRWVMMVTVRAHHWLEARLLEAEE